jgi:hypothetical protein
MGDSYWIRFDGEALRFEHTRTGHEPYEEALIRPSLGEWERFWTAVDRLQVWRWGGDYTPRGGAGVLDGTGSLRLSWQARRVEAAGNNAYPPDGASPEPSHAFRLFCEAVSELTGHEVA